MGKCPCLQLQRWPAPVARSWTSERDRKRTILNRGRARATWSTRYWDNLEQALSHFLGWLSAPGMLNRTGHPLRCTPDLLDAYVRFMLARVRPATAHHRVRHLEVALDVLGLHPDRTMFCKCCRFLLRLERKTARHVEPPSPAQLHALGLKLMKLADHPLDRRARVNAVMFRDGLLIALLAHRPLRRKNLGQLHIGADLVHKPAGWLIKLERGKLKNRKHVPMLWPTDLVPALERYLTVYRPILAYDHADMTELWLSYRGKVVTVRGLSEAVARRTKAEFGKAWRPHSIRKSVAQAASVADASVLLGDTPRVIQRSYAPSRRGEALRRHFDLLEERAQHRAT